MHATVTGSHEVGVAHCGRFRQRSDRNFLRVMLVTSVWHGWEGEERTDRRRKEVGKEKDEGDENLASNSRDRDSTRTDEKFTSTITRPLHFS